MSVTPDPTMDLHREPEHEPEQSNLLRNVLLVVAALYVAGSIWFMLETRGRLEKVEARQAAAESASADLGKRVSGVHEELKADTNTLASQVGMTQKQLASRASALQREQQQSEKRLSEQQKQQITAVSGEVAGVKTEVGSVKTDVANTRTDLESTKAKLERTIGDLGIQSGLIATTRDQLEILKHRGDRNYYEFTLAKGKSPSPVGTVSLQLKKTDSKRGKYTLNVNADDRTIEKKDKNLNEPVQFYSGRERQLFELVVFTVDKDRVTGYLSTPKGSPTPTEVNRN